MDGVDIDDLYAVIQLHAHRQPVGGDNKTLVLQRVEHLGQPVGQHHDVQVAVHAGLSLDEGIDTPAAGDPRLRADRLQQDEQVQDLDVRHGHLSRPPSQAWSQILQPSER